MICIHGVLLVSLWYLCSSPVENHAESSMNVQNPPVRSTLTLTADCDSHQLEPTTDARKSAIGPAQSCPSARGNRDEISTKPRFIGRPFATFHQLETSSMFINSSFSLFSHYSRAESETNVGSCLNAQQTLLTLTTLSLTDSLPSEQTLVVATPPSITADNDSNGELQRSAQSSVDGTARSSADVHEFLADATSCTKPSQMNTGPR